MTKPLKAVITGDIVHSQKIEPKRYDRLLKMLQELLVDLESKYQIKFDIYRGDQFQLVLQQPSQAIRVAALIRLALLVEQIGVRQSIAVGVIEPLRENVKSSTGEAFILSGQKLEKMKSELIRFSSSKFELQRHLSPTIMLFDAHLSSLTRTEALALSNYLHHPDESHKLLAARIGKSRPNTTKLLNSGAYKVVDAYLHYAEALIEQHEMAVND